MLTTTRPRPDRPDGARTARVVRVTPAGPFVEVLGVSDGYEIGPVLDTVGGLAEGDVVIVTALARDPDELVVIGRLGGSSMVPAHDHHASALTDGVVDLARLPVAPSGNANPTQIVRADDARLADARTPTAHTHGIADLPVAADGAATPNTLVRANDLRLNYLIGEGRLAPSRSTAGMLVYDNRTDSGWYVMDSAATGAPAAGTYHLEVRRLGSADTGYIEQVARKVDGSTRYVRRKAGGTWSAWRLDTPQAGFINVTFGPGEVIKSALYTFPLPFPAGASVVVTVSNGEGGHDYVVGAQSPSSTGFAWTAVHRAGAAAEASFPIRWIAVQQ